MNTVNQSRRRFLKAAGISSGLVVGVAFTSTGCTAPATRPAPGDDTLSFDAFLHFTKEGQCHFYLPHSEMGQGIYDGLTTLVAEELDLVPEDIVVLHAGFDKAFVNPEYGIQVTGGSNSMRSRFTPLRQAAANARAMLMQAAANQLDAQVTDLQTENGQVLWQGQGYNYGNFVAAASQLKLSGDAALKDPEAFRLIGKGRKRLDAMSKSNGSAVFGIDVDLPNLHRAALVRCPVYGGKPLSDNGEAIRKLPGVVQVVAIHNGVAVVATNYWQAKQAALQLKVEWDLPELSKHDSDSIAASFKQSLEEKGDEAHQSGDGAKALDSAEQLVEAQYWAPYLAHATMEPMNCTARIENGYCDIWVGCQSPEMARGMASLYGGVDKDKVTIHQTFLGGGFGRRAASDYVAEAASIAKATGLPIQVVWSREDDTRHDYYRPASLVRLQAGLNANGDLETWVAKRVGANLMPYVIDDSLDFMVPDFVPWGMADWLSKRAFGIFDGWVVDHAGVEGLYEDYDAVNKEVRHVSNDPGLRTGYWRSVGHSFSGFFKESFMDEVALAAGKDPVEMRLTHTKNNPRLHAVIKKAAELAQWGEPPASGHSLGFAAHNSFSSSVAQVAEVSVNNGRIRVHKVTCVVDCGLAVNPDVVKAQMEGGIIYGLSAALYGEINLKDGAVVEGNFHDYPVLRMSESPEITVHIMASKASPTGVGEPGLPPIAAAVGNGVYAATGKRLRSLPLKPS